MEKRREKRDEKGGRNGGKGRDQATQNLVAASLQTPSTGHRMTGYYGISIQCAVFLENARHSSGFNTLWDQLVLIRKSE